MATAAETSVLDELNSRYSVSRETGNRLKAYVEALQYWQRSLNLISPGTLEQIWHRHILDCAQLFFLAPQARIWVDLGSGAGLPGLVIAMLMKDQAPQARVHLIESNAKKAAFLHSISSQLALPVHIHRERIENVVPHLDDVDVVTARALASLSDLLTHANLLLTKGAVGFFPKGRDVMKELEAVSAQSMYEFSLLPSITDHHGRIVRAAAKPLRSNAV